MNENYQAEYESPPHYDELPHLFRRFNIQPREDEGREMLPPYSTSISLENVFQRKNEFESLVIRAVNRNWYRVLVTLRGTALSFHQCATARFFRKETKVESQKYSPDMPYGIRKGTLIKTYNLQYADVGIAADYVKKRYVIRIRAEAEQFLLSCHEIETFVHWTQSLVAAIDLATPLDDRQYPRDHSIPRSRRCTRRQHARNHESTRNMEISLLSPPAAVRTEDWISSPERESSERVGPSRILTSSSLSLQATGPSSLAIPLSPPRNIACLANTCRDSMPAASIDYASLVSVQPRSSSRSRSLFSRTPLAKQNSNTSSHPRSSSRSCIPSTSFSSSRQTITPISSTIPPLPPCNFTRLASRRGVSTPATSNHHLSPIPIPLPIPLPGVSSRPRSLFSRTLLANQKSHTSSHRHNVPRSRSRSRSCSCAYGCDCDRSRNTSSHDFDADADTDFTSDGKWRPHNNWTPVCEMLYARRCMAVLTSHMPRKSRFVVMCGELWEVDRENGRMQRYSKRMDAHGNMKNEDGDDAPPPDYVDLSTQFETVDVPRPRIPHHQIS